MIKGVFIINNNGKPRLLKCYERMVRTLALSQRQGRQISSALYSSRRASQTEDQQQAVVREIFSLLSKRSDAVCNFLEGGRYVVRR